MDEDGFFIDGASEKAPFVDIATRGRSLGTYANHSSSAPNAGYRWKVDEKRSPHALPGALWVTALEEIPEGCEIRVDYEAEGRRGQYWEALGYEPLEGEWKSIRMPSLPPGGLALESEHCTACERCASSSGFFCSGCSAAMLLPIARSPVEVQGGMTHPDNNTMQCGPSVAMVTNL